MAKEVQQFGATTSQLASYKGKNKQIVVNRDNHRIHVMDGTTNGGVPHALKSEVDAAQAKADAALPKSGGTIEGALTVKRDMDDANIIQVFTRSTVSETPSTQQMRSWRCVDKNGAIVGDFRTVQATDGRNYSQVLARRIVDGTQVDATLQVGVKSDGSKYCNFDGNSVITSSGGTFNNNIKFSQADGVIFKGDATGRTIIRSGTTYVDGGSVYFYGANYSNSGVAGGFEVCATDGANVISLKGMANDYLAWNGKEVERATWGSTFVKLERCGLLLCWGVCTLAANTKSATVTLPTAFVSNSYSVSTSGTSLSFKHQVVDKTVSNFVINLEGTTGSNISIQWIAAGKWK